MDKFTARDSNGAVDVNASAAAYATALSNWVIENELDTDVIETAVEAVFDRYNSVIPMGPLVNFAVNELGASPTQFKAFSTRVHAYVRGQITLGRYSSKKGTGGGVTRIAMSGDDLPIASV